MITLCNFLGAKLMHFVSKTSAFVSFCYKRFMYRYLFVSDNSNLAFKL